MIRFVAICIVGFRNASDITRCLSALESSSWTAFSVTICENGGDRAYQILAEAIPTRLSGGQTVKILNAGDNLGFAGGVNCCLAQTPEADAWWILNPDTEPEGRALELMVSRLDRGDCAAVGGTLVSPDHHVQAHGGQWRSWSARAVSLGMGETAAPDPAKIEALQNYLNGASMLVNRHFLETVGLMREDYFLYCEEVEWFVRAAAHKQRLGFALGAQVVHHQGSATGAVAEKQRRPRLPVYLDERNRMLLTRDHFARRVPIAATAALIRIILGGARRGAWRQIGYGLAGWWAGLKGKRGRPSFVAV